MIGSQSIVGVQPLQLIGRIKDSPSYDDLRYTRHIFLTRITLFTMKLTTSKQPFTEQPKKYCRLVVTEDTPSVHRLVETKDGQLEYRMGAGKWNEMTPRKFRTFLRSIVQAAKSHQIEHFALDLPSKLTSSPRSDLGLAEKEYSEWVMRTIAENLVLAAYEFTTYKSKVSNKKALKEIVVCGSMNKVEAAAFEQGKIVAHYTNITRDIANTSGDDMKPSDLAQAATAAAKGTKVKVTVLNKAKIKSLKMGLLEAVGKGASDEPKFIVMEYFGAGKPTKAEKTKAKQPIILIGKGITYDTGGLNVKPSGSMHEMHLDMSGGAAVIGAICAIAKLGLKQNVVALIPAAENAVSDRAMRAGDIVTAMNGKTIEVLHTDAEGRLVLADALTYAETFYQPKAILDCATLTGAALVALGQHASAIMTKDVALQEKLIALGEESGDLTWPLPLWEEYQACLKSDRADYTNIHKNFARWGGTIEGGTFLSFFAPKNVPWAHIDIAPRMESVPSDKLAKGAAGEPVRLLVRFVETY